ncbi:MAG: glycosyltransferase family 2 protein [Candidatus Omnitrophota bacterium]|nr:glycosyltransferase family 2 protein [Candidatus Omnitrophota bacterium]
MNPASCDIIIPVYNALEMTRNCLDSINDNTRFSFNMILVDNGSGRDTSVFLDEFKSANGAVAVIHNSENLGWVKAVNQGMKLSVSPYVCILNNDTIVKTDDWITKLIAIGGSAADIGLINPNFELERRARLRGKPFTEVDFCRGYCVLIKRAVMEKIGFLDEAYGLGYYDDDDYSVRAIRAGFRCVRANDVFVEHLRDSTFTAMFDEDTRMALHERNKMLFYSKWGRRLRLVFFITKDIDKKKVSELLIALARRQHALYLWNRASPLRLEHTLIHERVFPKVFPPAFFYFLIYVNSRKRKTKRYDLVFTDNTKFDRLSTRRKYRIHCLDLDREIDRITELVDSAAKDT